MPDSRHTAVPNKKACPFGTLRRKGARTVISSDTLLKVVTLIATTAVAIAVAIISWKQWRLSQEKLRLDLFNRRFDVYMRVLDLYQELLQWKGTAEQNALYIPFIKAVRESRFIFPRKSGVHPFLEEFQTHSFKIIHFEEVRDAFPSNDPTRIELGGARVQHANWILNSMAILEDKMAPYISFERL